MFRGRSNHLIDSKGRVNVPARFRDLIKTNGDPRLIVTNSDQCLAVYPYQEWQEIEEKVSQLSLADRDIRAYKRFFISGACECSLDSQSRILIPPTLREHAGLEKEVILVGQLKYFEIWDKVKFEKEWAKSKENLPVLEDKLASLGL
ncbi:MAG: division/cell wall cluster transcriptional repressor MraZ [Thermodesulfobacteriota bacterium]|jgi:MraZ protein